MKNVISIKNSVKKQFQLAWVKFDKDVGGGRKAPGMGNCSINIRDGSEVELAWFKKNSSYFEINFYYLVLQMHRFLNCVMF